MARIAAIALLCCFVAASACYDAYAQRSTVSTIFDTSVGVGYLFGSQTTRIQGLKPLNGSAPTLQNDPHMGLVSGSFELNPIWLFSGRATGGMSFYEGHTDLSRQSRFTVTQVYPWSVKPDYTTWELAGLIHLWQGAGYRFSAVGGYREELWKYVGDPSGEQTAGSTLREDVKLFVPFVALQTAMYQPWWKARVQVMGSNFMDRQIYSRSTTGTTLALFDGSAKRGGMVEMLFEGTAAFSSFMRMGLFGKYSFTELKGEATTNVDGAIDEHDIEATDNVGTVGVNFTVIF